MPGKGRPFGPDNPPKGRPKGSVSPEKRELSALIKAIASDPDYQASFKRRAIDGDPTLDKMISDRTLGPVPKVMQIETPKPLVIDLVIGPDASDSE